MDSMTEPQEQAWTPIPKGSPYLLSQLWLIFFSFQAAIAQVS